MRVLLVNWARIWDGAAHGGGVNGYCQSLAVELVRLGHDVAYLSSGVEYTRHQSGDAPIFSRRHPDWLGIRVFEIVNSPVLAPGPWQFKNPTGEVAHSALEREVASLARAINPDIVHFHNIEGFTAGCIRAVREGSDARAVLYSLHNYHTVCPQVYLQHRYTDACHDFDEGRRCESCIEAADPAVELARRLGPAPVPAVPPVPLTVGGHSTQPARLSERLKRAIGVLLDDRPVVPPTAANVPQQTISQPVETGVVPVAFSDAATAWRPLEPVAPDSRGQTVQILHDLNPSGAGVSKDPPRVPLTNDIVDAPAFDPNATGYAQRRRAMIDAINSCDRVLAVSEFVKRRFATMGVRESLIDVQYIGTSINRTRRAREELVFDPPPLGEPRSRPIRLVFMGHASVFKGLPMLADVLDALPARTLGAVHLFLFVQGGHDIEWRFRRMQPRLGGLDIYHGYQFWDIPWMLGGKDVGIVPSTWWDCAPQTVMEFFSCGVPVIGADVGGIPDFVRDGENGLLFRANDPADLARALESVVEHPSRLAQWRNNVRPSKGIEEHGVEMVSVYERCRQSRTKGTA